MTHSLTATPALIMSQARDGAESSLTQRIYKILRTCKFTGAVTLGIVYVNEGAKFGRRRGKTGRCDSVCSRKKDLDKG